VCGLRGVLCQRIEGMTMMPRVKCLVCGKKIRVPVSLEIVWEGVDQVLKSSPDTDRLWTHYEKHVLKGEW
jgi:hypothetical protein